ncbi:MAG: hypothetical protein HYU99_06155 [Deltaproteobacteria bacterium]|nr:hypothetical protein [Deltaproteobacteria bacterium]
MSDIWPLIRQHLPTDADRLLWDKLTEGAEKRGIKPKEWDIKKAFEDLPRLIPLSESLGLEKLGRVNELVHYATTYVEGLSYAPGMAPRPVAMEPAARLNGVSPGKEALRRAREEADRAARESLEKIHAVVSGTESAPEGLPQVVAKIWGETPISYLKDLLAGKEMGIEGIDKKIYQWTLLIALLKKTEAVYSAEGDGEMMGHLVRAGRWLKQELFAVYYIKIVHTESGVNIQWQDFGKLKPIKDASEGITLPLKEALSTANFIKGLMASADEAAKQSVLKPLLDLFMELAGLEIDPATGEIRPVSTPGGEGIYEDEMEDPPDEPVSGTYALPEEWKRAVAEADFLLIGLRPLLAEIGYWADASVPDNLETLLIPGPKSVQERLHEAGALAELAHKLPWRYREPLLKGAQIIAGWTSKPGKPIEIDLSDPRAAAAIKMVREITSTFALNHQAVYSALGVTDPRLADFYQREVAQAKLKSLYDLILSNPDYALFIKEAVRAAGKAYMSRQGGTLRYQPLPEKFLPEFLLALLYRVFVMASLHEWDPQWDADTFNKKAEGFTKHLENFPNGAEAGNGTQATDSGTAAPEKGGSRGSGGHSMLVPLFLAAGLAKGPAWSPQEFFMPQDEVGRSQIVDCGSWIVDRNPPHLGVAGQIMAAGLGLEATLPVPAFANSWSPVYLGAATFAGIATVTAIAPATVMVSVPSAFVPAVW